jgi:HK97 family phage portal protein
MPLAMSFWARLFGRRERMASVVAGADFAGASFAARGPPRRGTRELLIAYREQPWLRAVTSRIARGVASAGWSVYARATEPVAERGVSIQRAMPGGSGRRVADILGAPAWRWGRDRAVRDLVLSSPDPETRARRRVELAAAGLLREIPDHPLLQMLQRPNEFLTGRTSIQVSQTWLDIKGEAFWLLSTNKLGVPSGYFPLPPHWVTQVPTDAQPWFRVSFGTLQFNVAPEGMIWLRDPDPENPYGRGTGVAESLGDELETDEFAAKYLKSWFYNSAMPSFLVSFEGATKDQLTAAKEKWEQEHRGYGNAHRAHFASGKMNAVRLDASFRDQQISDLRKLQRDTVAQVFAMPPELIGIIENSNRSTIGAARYIYVLGVEYPRCEFIRTELQQQLVCKFDQNAVLECEVAIPDDEERRLGVMQAQPTAFSLNEWRSEAGYAPLEQFDGVFPAGMPGQLQPGAVAPEAEKETEPASEETELPEGSEPEEKAAAPSDPPWAKAPLR